MDEGSWCCSIWPSPKQPDDGVEKLAWRLEGAEGRQPAMGLWGVKGPWTLPVWQNVSTDVVGIGAHCFRGCRFAAAATAAIAEAAFLCCCGVRVEAGFLGVADEAGPSFSSSVSSTSESALSRWWRLACLVNVVFRQKLQQRPTG